MRAQAIRAAARLGFSIANRTEPAAPVPTRTLSLHSTLSKYPGNDKIKVDVWTPPRISVGPRPAIVNFHGGGWILGSGTDDARWAAACLTSLDAVVFSVNYRLAPSYPFPTPVEDCVDAIIQIADRAAEFGIDPNQVILSGFSAGATNAIGSWVAMQEPDRWNYNLPEARPDIAGLVLYYPGLDWTITRPEKRRTCAKPERTIPPALTDLIDASYVYPPIDRRACSDWRLSPGLMGDETLKKLPPIHMCLCEYDMLLREGVHFAQRLESNNKPLSLRIVKEERHAWDKPPPVWEMKESANVEYTEATQAIANWLGKIHDTDKDSTSSMKTKRLTLRRLGSAMSSRSAQ
jgi:acetyl esterase/lipase